MSSGFCVVGLLPEIIQVFDGEPLRVTCVIPDHLATVYNSSELVFEFQKESLLEEHDDDMVIRVNSTVAVLNYPALSVYWDKALVGCHVRRNTTIFVSRLMHVYRKCFSG